MNKANSSFISEKGTFIVRLQGRESATWQGQLTWVDRNITVGFRSALELIKLIDSAADDLEEKPEINEKA